jgi:hypothetical protein
MATALGVGVLYGTLVYTLLPFGVISLQRGHRLVFVLGLFVPLFWVIGAVTAPTHPAGRPLVRIGCERGSPRGRMPAARDGAHARARSRRRSGHRRPVGSGPQARRK